MNNDEIVQSLRNIEKYLEALVKFQYSQMKKQAIGNETEEKAFDLTGKKKRDDICDELHISSKTLTALWNRWDELGLLVKEGNIYKKTVEE